jgi:adenosylcobinamide kinase / adenosylcobinamide-phosphate guanylyltransferase
MHKKIIFITGGARSGKSMYALKVSSVISGNKAFIATAEALDEEMKDRIEKHRNQRGKGWDTCEESLRIAEVVKTAGMKYSAIVLDCLTLWLSNLFMVAQNAKNRKEAIELEIERFLDSLGQFKQSSVSGPASGDCALYIISNEVGMGIVPENETARSFRDWAGKLNQEVAEISDEVLIMVSGIPVKIKGKGKHDSGDN